MRILSDDKMKDDKMLTFLEENEEDEDYDEDLGG